MMMMMANNNQKKKLFFHQIKGEKQELEMEKPTGK